MITAIRRVVGFCLCQLLGHSMVPQGYSRNGIQVEWDLCRRCNTRHNVNLWTPPGYTPKAVRVAEAAVLPDPDERQDPGEGVFR